MELEFEEVDDTPSMTQKLFSTVNDLLGKSKDKNVKDDSQFADIREAVTALATHGAEQADKFAQLQQEHTATKDQFKAFTQLKSDYEKLANDFAELVKTLDRTPSNQHRQRPEATGGDGAVATDC